MAQLPGTKAQIVRSAWIDVAYREELSRAGTNTTMRTVVIIDSSTDETVTADIIFDRSAITEDQNKAVKRVRKPPKRERSN